MYHAPMHNHAPAYAHSPTFDGVIRTQAVAGKDLGKRISASVQRGPIAWMIAAVSIPIVAAVIWGLVTHPGRDSALVAALFGGSYALTGFIMFVVVPLGWRRHLRPGTPMSAEFAPAWIVVHIGKHRKTAALADIATVKSDANCLQLIVRKPLGTELVTIPNELVPPQIARDLVRVHGAR